MFACLTGFVVVSAAANSSVGNTRRDRNVHPCGSPVRKDGGRGLISQRGHIPRQGFDCDGLIRHAPGQRSGGTFIKGACLRDSFFGLSAVGVRSYVFFRTRPAHNSQHSQTYVHGPGSGFQYAFIHWTREFGFI